MTRRPARHQSAQTQETSVAARVVCAGERRGL